MKRGISPWTPEIPTQQQVSPRRSRKSREAGKSRNRTLPALLAGLIAFVVLVTVSVVFGINHQRVEAGTPIAVTPTHSIPTPDKPVQPTTTTTQPTTTTTQPPTSTPPSADYQVETGPGGVTVSIPSGWTITQPFASEDEADDPSGSGSLIRYGGTQSGSGSLLAAVTGDETSNTSVKTGYQQLQLAQVVSPTGDETVVWEFLFAKDGVQRHVLSWFWRAQGYDYLAYFSATEANWPTMQPIVTEAEQTAAPV